MNRKIHIGWFVVVLALCCIWLVFSSFTAVDSLETPELGNKDEAPAKTSIPRADEAPTTANLATASQPVSAPSGSAHPSQEQNEVNSLLAPVLPPSNYTLDSVTGSVVTAGGSQELTGTEGLFDRVMIGERETVSIRLDVPNLIAGEEVVVSASNGGRLERLNGPLRFVPKGDTAALDLKFTSTMGRGAYSIDVRHAGAVATVTLWAGKPLPVGEAGPDFIPLPPPSDIIP